MTYMNAVKFFLENDDYLIITHKNPDGDTLGSASALCSALRRIGKKAYLYQNHQITDKFFPFISSFISDDSFYPQTYVSTDIATENLFPEGFTNKVDFAFDHHPTYSSYAYFALINDKFSSCSEIIYEFIMKLCGNITKQESDLLYIGISTDTGCFLYKNTDSHTFNVASKLLKAGANNSYINQIFFRQVSSGRLKLEGMIYSGLRYYHHSNICVSIITKKMISDSEVTENDLDDIASLPGRSIGVSVGITIREISSGKCKVSVRTDETVNSIDICKYFGGGGHAMAAGCMISADPEKACDMIVSVTEEVIR